MIPLAVCFEIALVLHQHVVVGSELGYDQEENIDVRIRSCMNCSSVGVSIKCIILDSV